MFRCEYCSRWLVSRTVSRNALHSQNCNCRSTDRHLAANPRTKKHSVTRCRPSRIDHRPGHVACVYNHALTRARVTHVVASYCPRTHLWLATMPNISFLVFRGHRVLVEFSIVKLHRRSETLLTCCGSDAPWNISVLCLLRSLPRIRTEAFRPSMNSQCCNVWRELICMLTFASHGRRRHSLESRLQVEYFYVRSHVECRALLALYYCTTLLIICVCVRVFVFGLPPPPSCFCFCCLAMMKARDIRRAPSPTPL